MIKTIYKCDCCGEEFLTDRGFGGLADHEALYNNRCSLSANLRELCMQIVLGSSPGSFDNMRVRDAFEINQRLNCVMLWETLSGRKKEQVVVYSKRLADYVKERKSVLDDVLDRFRTESKEQLCCVWEGIDE